MDNNRFPISASNFFPGLKNLVRETERSFPIYVIVISGWENGDRT